MPGLEKTSGKVSYGASGQNAKKGNTKKRVRGQEKKRARRKGKEDSAIREMIKSEIFNVVVASLTEGIIREGKESKILDYLDKCGIPRNDMMFSGSVLTFLGGMQQAIKGKECLLKPNSPLNARGKKGLRQQYNTLMWIIPGHVGGTGAGAQKAVSMAVETKKIK